MQLSPRFELLPEKILTGIHTRMSLTMNKTAGLWRSFMPRRNEISEQTGNLLYSVEVYDPGYFDHFNAETTFEKWAAMEVKYSSPVPEGMDVLILPGGLNAVFTYKGPASEGYRAYQYIYETWIHQSGFVLDDRPHFAVMGEKYKNNGEDSEEEIWVPVREITVT